MSARGERFELWFPNGQVVQYAAGVLVSEAQAGIVRRSHRARVLSEKHDRGDWSTVGECPPIWKLLSHLHRPIKAGSLLGMKMGALIGCVLQALYTATLLFQLDTRLGCAWLAVMASLGAAPKVHWLPVATLAFVSLALDLRVDFMLMVFGVAMVGGVLGGAAGTSVGATVGALRARGLPRVVDRENEGLRTYALTMFLPLCVFLAAGGLNLAWLAPRFLDFFA